MSLFSKTERISKGPFARQVSFFRVMSEKVISANGPRSRNLSWGNQLLGFRVTRRCLKGAVPAKRGTEPDLLESRVSWDVRVWWNIFLGKGEAKAVSFNWGFPRDLLLRGGILIMRTMRWLGHQKVGEISLDVNMTDRCVYGVRGKRRLVGFRAFFRGYMGGWESGVCIITRSLEYLDRTV